MTKGRMRRMKVSRRVKMETSTMSRRMMTIRS